MSYLPPKVIAMMELGMKLLYELNLKGRFFSQLQSCLSCILGVGSWILEGLEQKQI